MAQENTREESRQNNEILTRISRLEQVVAAYQSTLQGLITQLHTYSATHESKVAAAGIQPLIPLLADQAGNRAQNKCAEVAPLEITEAVTGKVIYNQGASDKDCGDPTPEDIGKAIADAEDRARRMCKERCKSAPCPISLDPLGFRPCNPVITKVKLVRTNQSWETGHWNGVEKRCYVTADIEATVACRCGPAVPLPEILL